jgi:DNA-binding MarR family transcriptional regulator
MMHQIEDMIPKCEESVLDGIDITNQQLLVLLAMVYISEIKDSPIIITSLVPYQNRSLNSMSSIIDRMEKKGLVQKVWDLPDRRAARLIMSPKGEEVLEAASSPNAELIKRLVSVFSAEELEIFISLVKKLRRKMREELGLEEVSKAREKKDVGGMTKFLNRLHGY